MCGAGSVPCEGLHRAVHTGAHTSLGGCSAEHVNHLHELNTTSIALLWNPSVCFVKRFTVACVGGAAGELYPANYLVMFNSSGSNILGICTVGRSACSVVR